MAKTTPGAAAAPEKSGFWSLGGIAAVITAVAAVVVALKKEPEKPAIVAPTASAPVAAVAATDSASTVKAMTTAAPETKPAQTTQPQTATAGNGGKAFNVSGNGNQVSVGK